MDYTVEYVQITGTAAACLPIIKNRVSNLAAHCRHFYIGLTNRPEDRMREHRRDDGILWDRMVVLYQTTSLKKEGDFEEDLILYYKSSKYSRKLTNDRNGRQGPTTAPPLYIYAIFKY